MGSALKGKGSFEYDGETINLTINNSILMDAEEVLGYSALDAVEEAKNAIAQGRNPMLRTVVAIFYGAVVQEQPHIDQKTAIDMFMDEGKAAQKAFLDALKGTDMPALGNPAAAASNTQKAKGRKKSLGPGKKSS